MSHQAFVYPVHPSLLFMTPQSVNSALYLLSARLLDRDYVGASRLVPQCVSDVEGDTEQR